MHKLFGLVVHPNVLTGCNGGPCFIAPAKVLSSGHVAARGAILYSFEADDVMSGNDILLSQGWPESIPGQFSGITDAQRKDLGACSVSLPCISSILGPFFYQPFAPWWEPEEI